MSGGTAWWRRLYLCIWYKASLLQTPETTFCNEGKERPPYSLEAHILPSGRVASTVADLSSNCNVEHLVDMGSAWLVGSKAGMEQLVGNDKKSRIMVVF